MTVLSFIAMYILMYAMVNELTNVYPSFNQFYMAAVMTAAMVVIELIVMGGMYPNKRLNGALVIASVLLLALFWTAIRQQTAINDRQFLKSMIPHHAGAILMCKQAVLKDADVLQLCENIKRGQQQEIDWMKAKLREMDR